MVLVIGDPAHVPEQRAQRPDRGHQHPAGACCSPSRCCSCAASRPTCCPSAPWISASSSIPRSSWSRTSTATSAPASTPTCRSRTASCGPATRSRTAAVLLDAHHGVRLHPAVHHAGAGGADLRPDGRDLRLRPGRRPAAGPDCCRRCCACCSSSNLKPAPDNFLVRFLKSALPAAARRLSEPPLGRPLPSSAA